MLRISIDKMKDNGFRLTKERSKRYSAQTITDAEYTVDIALQENTPAQAESLLHFKGVRLTAAFKSQRETSTGIKTVSEN